ncbi:hypothetical protein NPIL_508641 [Nephila pilipes]|uniref:Uncharacterized protein n=1 Tax=Nephila pilipes TaxID=299642 RepID=A0A8X6MHR2_NEPPI|nr:hypothetical protein NPIL_508641 [Nephila pilipes]
MLYHIRKGPCSFWWRWGSHMEGNTSVPCTVTLKAVCKSPFLLKSSSIHKSSKFYRLASKVDKMERCEEAKEVGAHNVSKPQACISGRKGKGRQNEEPGSFIFKWMEQKAARQAILQEWIQDVASRRRAGSCWVHQCVSSSLTITTQRSLPQTGHLPVPKLSRRWLPHGVVGPSPVPQEDQAKLDRPACLQPGAAFPHRTMCATIGDTPLGNLPRPQFSNQNQEPSSK